MKLTASAFFGLALLISGEAVWAEQSDEAKAWSQFFFEEVLQRSCDDPTMESAIALPQPKLILHATDEGKGEINVRAGLEWKKVVTSLEVKSPRKSSDETTTLASLEGLSRGTTLDAKVSWFRWDPPDIDKMKGQWAGKNLPDPSAKCTEDAHECADREMQKAVNHSMDTGWRMEDFLRPSLSRPSARAILGSTRYDEAAAAYRAWMRAYNKMVPVFTVNGHAEQKDSDFFVPSAGPPAGLKQTSESHTNYKVTGSVGAYLWGTFYSSLNYSRGTEFKDGKMKDFCTAAPITGILSCQSLTIAPPKQERAEKLEFEARGLAGPVGFSAHVTRDLQANVTMVDVPVYLLQNLSTSKMELNLGVRLHWQSDTRKYAVSVFIGPALSSVLRMFGI